MSDALLEARLRSAAASYERLAPAVPDLERRIYARIAVTSRACRQRRRHRSWPMQLLAAAALIAFALALAFLMRESRLFRPQQPVATPTPSPQSLSVVGSGSQAAAGLTMVSPDVGWWGDNDGHLLRTTDAGMHWTDVTPAGIAGLNDYYVDEMDAWIVGTTGTVKAGVIPLVTFRTVDGGRSWQQGNQVSADYGGWTQIVKYGPVEEISLYFLDDVHGWLLAPNGQSRTLFSTGDGGLHWRTVAVAPGPGTSSCQWSRMSFASLITGWMTMDCANPSAQRLLVTHNGGVSWQAQRLPAGVANTCPQAHYLYWPFSPLTRCFEPPRFFDQSHGVLLVPQAQGGLVRDTLLTTTDGGSTWRVRSLPGQVQLEVEFSDATHGWAIAGSAAEFNVVMDQQGMPHFSGPMQTLPLYRTDNGGSTWVRVQTPLVLESPQYGQLEQLRFIDPSAGFAQYSSGLLKTTDGGRAWSTVPVAS